MADAPKPTLEQLKKQYSEMEETKAAYGRALEQLRQAGFNMPDAEVDTDKLFDPRTGKRIDPTSPALEAERNKQTAGFAQTEVNSPDGAITVHRRKTFISGAQTESSDNPWPGKATTPPTAPKGDLEVRRAAEYLRISQGYLDQGKPSERDLKDQPHHYTISKKGFFVESTSTASKTDDKAKSNSANHLSKTDAHVIDSNLKIREFNDKHGKKNTTEAALQEIDDFNQQPKAPGKDINPAHVPTTGGKAK